MSQYEAPLARAIRIENELLTQCAQVYGVEQARMQCARVQQRCIETLMRTNQTLAIILSDLTARARRQVKAKKV